MKEKQTFVEPKMVKRFRVLASKKGFSVSLSTFALEFVAALLVGGNISLKKEFKKSCLGRGIEEKAVEMVAAE